MKAAALHEALEALRPVSRDEIPTDDASLSSYIRDLLIQARFIVESVPEPSSISPTISTSASPSSNDSKTPPPSTIPPPIESSSTPALQPKDIAALQKEWGKPLNKIDNAKDNPLRIPIYKLKSKDGKGTWFARRSVHVGGLPYSRFKDKLQSELAETLRIHNETGEVSSIRGVGSEKCLEKRTVTMPSSSPLQNEAADSGNNGNELATIEVHHLSAHFPGPSTSRDFVTFVVASDKALEVSCPKGEAKVDGDVTLPRNFVLISKPCKHPDAPVRQDYVRGEYESVEMIRELPTAAGGLSADGGDENPVEWIMITRSDPGGSIPKWMVEKGTIPSIVADAKKFIDWATKSDPGIDREEEKSVNPQPSHCGPSHAPEPIQVEPQTQEIPIRQRPTTEQASVVEEEHLAPNADLHDAETEPSLGGGLAAGFLHGVASTLESVAPKALFDYVHLPGLPGQLVANDTGVKDEDDTAGERTTSLDRNYSSSGSSIASFASVDSRPKLTQDIKTEANRSSVEDSYPPSLDSKNINELPVPSVKETNSTAGSSIRSFKGNMMTANSSDKDIAKLEVRKAKVIKELEDVHEERSKLLLEISQPPASSDNSVSEINETVPPPSETKKTDAANKKQLVALERKETKLSSRLRKIDTQQQKIFTKIEAKRRKEAEKDEKAKLKAEIEMLKKEKEQMKTEMDELRGERSHWLGLVAKLQHENTMLVAEQQKRPGYQEDGHLLNG